MSEQLHEHAYSSLDDDFEWPVYCPVCGRPLERASWGQKGEYRYEYRVCFGGACLGRWWANRVKIATPKSAHYVFEDYSARRAPEPLRVRFDRRTGEPVA